MNCKMDFYFCKNLLYWERSELKGYVCTISGEPCSCQGTECICLAYADEFEE